MLGRCEEQLEGLMVRQKSNESVVGEVEEEKGGQDHKGMISTLDCVSNNHTEM